MSWTHDWGCRTGTWIHASVREIVGFREARASLRVSRREECCYRRRMKQLRFDLALWMDPADGHTYGFPLGVKDGDGQDVLPAVDFGSWVYRGTVPKSCRVAQVTADQGNRVIAQLNGVLDVYTADWALK